MWKQQLRVQPHGRRARRAFWNLVVQEVWCWTVICMCCFNGGPDWVGSDMWKTEIRISAVTMQENKTSRSAQVVLHWDHQSLLPKRNIWTRLQLWVSYFFWFFTTEELFCCRFILRNECVLSKVLVWLVIACVGGSERPCHGNGVCDGDGTRGGNGKCSCNHGYTGEFCLDCIDGHFNEARNDTFSLCTGDSQSLPVKLVHAKPV